MKKNNFERMIQLVTEIFDSRNDPEQLDVTEDVIKRLQQIHPATLSEFSDENGPVVWILVIPTTTDVMNEFVQNKISEREILDLTPVNKKYDALYLCSASVLPEYRRKGLAKKLTIESIEKIRQDYPIKTLFVWPFSKEGEKLAEKISAATNLPLLKK